MAMTPNSIITVQAPKVDLLQFSTADTAGVNKTLSAGAANGSKIVGLFATSNDAGAAHLMTVQMNRSGVNYGGAAVTVPVSAGFTNGNPAINLMSTAIWPGLPIDSDGNPFIFLSSTLDNIVATYGTAITAAASVNLAAMRGDF